MEKQTILLDCNNTANFKLQSSVQLAKFMEKADNPAIFPKVTTGTQVCDGAVFKRP